ncbi:MAG: hypothetical protein NZL85_07995 [Fimbriimonadales bacterium]|nr:hypothetical protein [Fimbriimonadales bacterium]
MAREKVTLGLFLTLEPPTAPMLQEAEQAGYYTTPLGNLKLPKLQVRTVGQLLRGEGFQIPSAALLIGASSASRVEKVDRQAQLEW